MRKKVGKDLLLEHMWNKASGFFELALFDVIVFIREPLKKFQKKVRQRVGFCHFELSYIITCVVPFCATVLPKCALTMSF